MVPHYICSSFHPTAILCHSPNLHGFTSWMHFNLSLSLFLLALPNLRFLSSLFELWADLRAPIHCLYSLRDLPNLQPDHVVINFTESLSHALSGSSETKQSCSPSGLGSPSSMMPLQPVPISAVCYIPAQCVLVTLLGILQSHQVSDMCSWHFLYLKVEPLFFLYEWIILSLQNLAQWYNPLGHLLWYSKIGSMPFLGTPGNLILTESSIISLSVSPLWAFISSSVRWW